jgi:hypothetical protein
MMSISNHILSDIFILPVFESESGHKYENKYDISDIRSVFIPNASTSNDPSGSLRTAQFTDFAKTQPVHPVLRFDYMDGF